MDFAPIDESKLDPIPQGFAAIDESKLDASPQEYSPLEAFGFHATNVFGGGAAIGGLVNSLIRGGNYADWRDAFRKAQQESKEQNPKAALAGSAASIVPETILGGAAGKAVSGLAKGTQIAEGLSSFATQNPVLGHVLEGIGAGGAYGAASGAGEAISEGKDTGDVLTSAAKSGLGGAAVGGIFGAGVGAISKASSGAVAREESQIVKGALKGTEAKEVREEVVSMLRKDPELKSIIAKPSEESIPLLRERLSGIEAERNSLLDTIDGGKGISIGRFAKSIDAEIERLGKTPLTEKSIDALNGLKESVLKSWAPADIRDALSSKEAQQSTTLRDNLLKKLDSAFVPSKRFVELERSAEDAFTGGQKAAVQKAIGDSVIDHLSKADKGISAQIEKLNKNYSSLSAIIDFVGNRSESVEGMGKLLSIFTHHGPAGAAIALATGHPIPAAILAAPALAKKGNQVLAYLQREAAAGNARAINVLKAAEAAQTVGTAISGAAGSAKAQTLSEQLNNGDSSGAGQ
jgi:hypothetical protein